MTSYGVRPPMTPADAPRPSDSPIVKVLTWVAFPFVLVWMTLKSALAAVRRLGARLLALARAAAQALAVTARRVGDAIRITLATMADGLRRIGSRLLLLARTAAELLTRPLRLALAAVRRLGARLLARAAVLYFDAIGTSSVLTVQAYQALRLSAHTFGSRVLAAAGLAADLGRSTALLARSVVATTWRVTSHAVGRVRAAVVAGTLVVWRPLRWAVGRAASVLGRAMADLWGSVRMLTRSAIDTVRRGLRVAREWASRFVDAVRSVVSRAVKPVRLAMLLVVGAVVLGARRARSIMRALLASVRRTAGLIIGDTARLVRSAATGVRTAVTRALHRSSAAVRQVAEALRSTIGGALRRAAQQVRDMASRVRIAIRQAAQRASASIRRASASARLAVTNAKESVAVAGRSARDAVLELLGRPHPPAPR